MSEEQTFAQGVIELLKNHQLLPADSQLEAAESTMAKLHKAVIEQMTTIKSLNEEMEIMKHNLKMELETAYETIKDLENKYNTAVITIQRQQADISSTRLLNDQLNELLQYIREGMKRFGVL